MLSQPILFIATTNADAALDFYQNKLGFTLQTQSPFAIVFDAMGQELRIQKVEQVQAAPYTQLGWRVDDIKNCITTLHNKGVKFERFDQLQQDELAIWHTPDGAQVAWFKDPDGNTLSLTQSA